MRQHAHSLQANADEVFRRRGDRSPAWYAGMSSGMVDVCLANYLEHVSAVAVGPENVAALLQFCVPQPRITASFLPLA
jgi:hypothetical protein